MIWLIVEWRWIYRDRFQCIFNFRICLLSFFNNYNVAYFFVQLFEFLDLILNKKVLTVQNFIIINQILNGISRIFGWFLLSKMPKKCWTSSICPMHSFQYLADMHFNISFSCYRNSNFVSSLIISLFVLSNFFRIVELFELKTSNFFSNFKFIIFQNWNSYRFANN